MQKSTANLLRYLSAIALLLGAALAIITSALFLYLNPKLPSVDTLKDAKLQVPLRIYSTNGELIGEFGEKFRTPLAMEDVPAEVIQAFLAAEDDRFLKHKGVDIGGLLRAAIELISSGEIRSGGSTITMQVARNFFLSNEQTFVRKFNEIFLALKIERTLSKSEILELYLNKIYLGKRAYGVQAASAIYYGKKIHQLSTAQVAMIAGLPKAPSAYNPINNAQRALQRRNWILGRMKKLGFIDDETMQLATNEPVSARYHGPKLQLDAGYAAEMAREFAINKLGLAAYTDGYKIITTINADQQRSAQQAIRNGLDAYTQRHGYRNTKFNFANLEHQQKLNKLRNIKLINQLFPAIVMGFEINDAEKNKDAVTLLLADDNTLALPWDKEHQQLRKFINQDQRSAKAEKPQQLLSVGDLVYLRYDKNNKPYLAQLPAASASLVALTPYNGAIQALVGGYAFELSNFNRATQAYRQPGSNFKPFIYSAALANGYTAAYRINDAPIVFEDNKLETDWRPENASGKFYGLTTLRRALYLSRNIVSVRLLQETGISNAIKYLERFELKAGKLPRDLSLALGSYALAPIDVAKLYAVIANGGYLIQPHLVTEIRDRHNNLVYIADPVLACDDCPQRNIATHAGTLVQHDEFDEAGSLDEILESNSSHSTTEEHNPPTRLYPSAPRIMDERVAYIIDSILKEVITRGTAVAARALQRSDIAGKTGTTNGPTDAWFSGYHPHLVATTWLGFDDNQLLGRNEYGGSAALPIWMAFMGDALKNLPLTRREQPAGIRSIKIDRMTGLPPTAQTTQTLFELFRKEYAPAYNSNNLKQPHESMQIFDEELF
jgi:penicillin-binding protein 1A